MLNLKEKQSNSKNVKENGTPATLYRSQSIPNVVSKDICENHTNGRISHSKYSSSSTPTHICTPRRQSELKRKYTDNSIVTPVKLFSSDSNLTKSSVTPDCYNRVCLDTPQQLLVQRGEETSNLTVCVRVRPLNYKEKSDCNISNVISVNGNEIQVFNDSGCVQSFNYDQCFWSCDPHHPQYADQESVFESMVKPLVVKAFDGYNACLFAYGQTGSGKSYSMLGQVQESSSVGKEAGIIPRFCQDIFKQISVKATEKPNTKITVEISYFEIYNEKIHDLLSISNEHGKRGPLKVREHPVFGPYVVDLSTYGVQSYEDLQGWLMVGNSQRVTASTSMNERSSRSHSIFSLILTQIQDEENSDYEHIRRSKINLVDLAGSERISQSSSSGDRLRESVSINKSLLTLGKVIAALAENPHSKRKTFVPYRESVLTWLLRESLGGNSRTTMLATISPASVHVEETMSTLRYACQARSIVNRVRVNEDPQDRIIRELRAEVERLRARRRECEHQTSNNSLHFIDEDHEPRYSNENMFSEKEKQIEALRDMLKQSEAQLANAEKSWSERLQEAENCKSAQLKYLKQCGIALNIEWNENPCLVNLLADPMLSETLLYIIPPGRVIIGRQTNGSDKPDITLSGPLVEVNHCSIVNDRGSLTLHPGSSGQTYVNGQEVSKEMPLFHGDRLVIGGNHYFRVSNPSDCNDAMDLKDEATDFHFAQQEIHSIQEKRLQEELDSAKRQALLELEAAKKEAERQLSSQRLLYEQQLKELGSSLEKQKDALAEVQKRKEELEIQKAVLEDEVKMQQRKKFAEESFSFNISQYKSNFLEEVESALNCSVTVDVPEQSELNEPELTLKDYSLHRMKMMVQEANQRCKEIGINYLAQHQQVLDDRGLSPKIKITDLDKYRSLLWKPTTFLKWLYKLRDFEPNDSLKELIDFDEDWFDEEECYDSLDEGNGSVISVNTDHIKRQLNESINMLNYESCIVNDSNNCTDDNQALEAENARYYLQQMNEAIENLQSLNICQDESIIKLLHTMETNVDELLELVNGSVDDTNISDQISVPVLDASPFTGKSNLSSKNKDIPKTRKNVRFLLTDSQLNVN